MADQQKALRLTSSLDHRHKFSPSPVPNTLPRAGFKTAHNLSSAFPE